MVLYNAMADFNCVTKRIREDEAVGMYLLLPGPLERGAYTTSHTPDTPPTWSDLSLHLGFRTSSRGQIPLAT